MISAFSPFSSFATGQSRPLADRYGQSVAPRRERAFSDAESTVRVPATGRAAYTEEELTRLLALHEREQAALAPERAYAAAGRQYQRSAGLGGEAASAAWVFAAMQPGSGAAAPESGSVSGRPQSPHPVRSGESGDETRRADGAKGSALAGGLEARSAERTFIGDSAASPDARHQEREAGAGDDPEAAGAGRNDSNGEDAQSAGRGELSREEEVKVQEMQSRDREVRTHEQAHVAAGAGLVAGGASYQKERGPDGKMYAVGGEVQIDTSEASSPAATIAKAQRVKAAALAPAQPSAQDRQVAAQASRMEAEARQEKAAETDEDGKRVSAKTERHWSRSDREGEGADSRSVAGAESDALYSAGRRAGRAYALAAGNRAGMPRRPLFSVAV